jgi:AcrR family transcriptional regulator
MNAVAETAGVALGTLYRNFSSKAELMVEVVAEVAQREVDAVAKIAMEDGTAAERLSASAWLFASRALLGRKNGARWVVWEPV